MNIYDFTVKDGDGNDVSLRDYEGKVLLIVNTATECGFTPQYDYLQDLYEKYADDDFIVLDFPCNQFGHQAPGSHDQIFEFCSQRFGITFPIFDKIEVNGKDAHPLFSYLKSEKGFNGFDEFNELTPTLIDMYEKKDPNYASNPDIKWNFTKFLVDRSGNVVKRFEPTHPQEDVENHCHELIME